MMTRHRLSPDLPAVRRNSGFTLVELVICIVLVGMLAAVGSTMMVDTFSTSRMVNADNASMGQARYTLERLAREIREIKYDSTNNSYCITTMTASNLVFYKTTGGGVYNSVCATNAYAVTINYANPNLTLQYSSPAVTAALSNQAASFALQYLDAAGAATVLASAIRFVVITLTVTDTTSGQSFSQRTRVALRNA